MNIFSSSKLLIIADVDEVNFEISSYVTNDVKRKQERKRKRDRRAERGRGRKKERKKYVYFFSRQRSVRIKKFCSCDYFPAHIRRRLEIEGERGSRELVREPRVGGQGVVRRPSASREKYVKY